MSGKKKAKKLANTPIDHPSITIDIRPEREISMNYRYMDAENNKCCDNCSRVKKSDGKLSCDLFMKYTDSKNISNDKTWKNKVCKYHTV